MLKFTCKYHICVICLIFKLIKYKLQLNDILGSDDSSPLPIFDRTSGSSDTSGSGKINDDVNSYNDKWSMSENNAREPSGIQNFQPPQDPEKESNPAEQIELLDNAEVTKSDSVSNHYNN